MVKSIFYVSKVVCHNSLFHLSDFLSLFLLNLKKTSRLKLQDELAELCGRTGKNEEKLLSFHSIFSFLAPLLTITNFQLLASQQVSSAAIAGLDGNIWAKSSGFNCSPDEVKRILGSWENKNGMGMNGVTVNGMK